MIDKKMTTKVQFWVNGIMMGLNSREDAEEALATGKWKKINDQAIDFVGDRAYQEITGK